MVLESNTLDVLFVKDGQQGEDGKVLYTWIKYAKDASGTGITDDPNGAIYIGISYNNESSIESNDPTQYAWTKIQGADGKKGEDAYTIFLENENISFATDKNRNPLSEQAYTSGITIMKGAKPVTDFTIGDIAKTQGIAVAKTDTAIAISVINGNPLPSDNGEIVIPITVGGTVFKKILSWTCSKKGDKGIQGIQGPQGVQGEKGKDGTSVTISNKSITYQLSASGTVVPTGTWQTSPQTIPEGQYQWTKTSVTYSDGNKTESYSISYHGKNGNDGTSVKTTSTSVKYQVGDSGTTKPTGTWQSNVPTVAQGKYLWTQTIVNYSDGNSTESYSVSYRGIDGSNGVNGMNAATIYLYQRATSTPSKPSNTLTYTFSTTKITGTLNNGWSTAIPTGTDAVYVTVASVSNKNDTATIATSAWSAPVVLAQNGKTGSDGKAGLNVATIYLYQRNTSKPSKPSASVTYTFSTGVASGLNNGWSQKIPDGTNPLYVTLATASSNTATDTILSSEWSDVVVMAQNGEDGQDGISPKVSLSKTGDTTTISIIDATGTHTQTVKDGTNGTPGAAGKDGKTSYFHVKYSNDGGKTFTGNSGEDTGIYMGSYTDYTEADSTDVKKYNWVKVKGDKGDTGQKGQDGTSIKITSKSVTYQTSTSGTTAPTGTWSTTVPTINNGQYLWTKTTVQYSDGNKTEAYSVSYKGTNGTNGTSVTVSKTEVTYQVSTSGTTAPTGAWSTTMPTCDQGLYLWTKTYVKYSDGKDTTSYAVSYKGVDGEKFSWNLFTCSTLTDGDQENKANWRRGFINNSTHIGYTNDGFHFTTNEQGLKDSNGISFNISRDKSGLHVGDTVTFSVDIKGTIGTGNPQMQYWGSTKTDSSDWATRVFGDSLKTVKKDSYTRYSVTVILGDLYSSKSNDLFCVGGGFDADLYIKNIKLEKCSTATPWAPHPEDLEGRGVSQTVQYYLATSQASGVTSSTSGWSTDITTQKLTADKKYLWNCYQTKYSDGTSEPISTPKVIGVYGDKGQKGDNAKNLTITPSSQYFKSTDGGKTFAPNTITIKPTLQGEISFGKWQYSIDGGVSFADVVSGQKGLMISNNVLTVSKDSSLYSDAVTMVTFRAVASDSSFYDTCSIAKIYDVNDIGDGRNLLWNSNFAKTDEAITGTTNSWGLHTRGTNLVASIDTSTKHNGFNTLKTVSAANGDKNSSNDLEWFAWGISERTSDNLHSKNQNYTLSFYAKASVTTDFIVRWGYDAYGADTTRTLTTNWQKYEIKLHQATSAYSITIIFKLLTAGTVWFSEFKLEKGSSATGYSTAPEDLQTAILSTKSEISDVSLKVDKNKQAIEQRVEKTTYQQDLNLVKGDISKANEGLNKWRYEIYPKSLFDSTDQGKSTIDIFAKNKNLTPSRTVLFNDTDLSIQWNSAENYIGYALTFTKFSAAKSVAITFAHDDGAHIYLNGKLIGGSDVYSQTGESLTLGFVKGWNCIEVVVNDKNSYEGFTLGTTISTISECQLMNCYYGTPVARQSHITNQLVENTTNIKGISTKVSKVTSVIGDNGENFTSFKNEYSDFKQTMNGFKTTVSQTYVTKDDFNGLEIGGRNLLLYSQTIRAHNDYYNVGWLTDEVETFNGCPVWSVKNQWGKLAWLFKSHVIDRGLVKVGDTLTYSLYAKTNNASGKSINCSYRFKGDANAYWFNGSGFNVGTSWARYSVTFTVTKDMLAADTYMTEIGFEETASMSGDDKVYYACPKLERGTKATDYTPAPEDNEINGQNLVSNLPSNWEQGSINYTANLAYGSLKSTLVSRLRTKDVFPVSGNITISAGTSTNSSKEELNFYYVLFDINKKSISHGDTWQSLTSPKIINCGNAKYMAIILRWGSGSTAITPSDISQICLKIERGTSATPFTLAPEDVNGKIINVETIANQTAKQFEWIVKGGDSSSNFTLTDRVADLVAERINFNGLVKFSGTTNLIENSNMMNGLANITSECKAIKVIDDSTYRKALVITPIAGGRIFWGVANVWKANITYTVSFVAKSSVAGQKIKPSRSVADWGDEITLTTSYVKYTTRIKSTATADGGTLSFSFSNAIGDVTLTNVKLETGMNPTDWSPAPGDYITQASLVRNWTTNTTWINGGKIYTGSITADKIAANSITADKIATDAIKSRNYISSSGTQGSFLNLSDGSFISPNLSWDSNGNLIAKNANLSGQITATKGSIGGWSVDNYSIYTTYDADQNIFGSGISGTKGKYVLWAGETNNAIGANRSSDTPTDASLVIYNNGGLEVRKTMVGNDKKNHLYTTILQSGQINLKMDDNYIGTITATDTIFSNSTVTMSHVSMAAKKGYGWSILHTDDSGNLISDIQRDPSDTKIKINSPITVSSTDISKYNAIETTGDVVVSGKIHANYGSNKIQLNPDNNGSIELYGYTPFIDFHYGNSDSDYTSRIIAQEWGLQIVGTATVTGDLYCDAHIYTCTNGHFSWAGQTDAYLGCGNYSGGNNIYYYANYHAFYVNNDSGSGMMYINTNGVTSRVGFTKTSDERIKKNFESFDDNIIDAYMNIEPVKYQLKQSSNDNYHFGFKAQHVDKVFSDYGDTYNESFDICTSRPIDPDKAKELYGVDDMTEEYGLRYDELIAPTTYMVQHIYKELESTKGELAKVKQEKADLETRLQAIEAKLGL